MGTIIWGGLILVETYFSQNDSGELQPYLPAPQKISLPLAVTCLCFLFRNTLRPPLVFVQKKKWLGGNPQKYIWGQNRIFNQN